MNDLCQLPVLILFGGREIQSRMRTFSSVRSTNIEENLDDESRNMV